MFTLILYFTLTKNYFVTNYLLCIFQIKKIEYPAHERLRKNILQKVFQAEQMKRAIFYFLKTI